MIWSLRGIHDVGFREFIPFPDSVIRSMMFESTMIPTAEAWRSLFENWPDSMPKTGLLVSKFGETIPFTNFMISGGLLLVERDKPDTHGARKVILSYDSISGVKMTTAADIAAFQVLGFQSNA